MEQQLEPKRVCVLTGASGTLGTAFIQRHSADYQIVAVHNNREIKHATQDKSFLDPLDQDKGFPENESPVFAIQTDLTNARAISALCKTVLDQFGKVDLLINGAAFRHWPKDVLTADSTTELNAALAVNVVAPLRLSIEFARQFWSSRNAEENVSANRNIINISSTAGIYVYPDLGQIIYGMTKAALNMISYHLASEFWGMGVRVNTVAPTSFPSHVTTESVLDAMAQFDANEDTGQLVILDVPT
jgi:NAD(P)-dependent dehydrogenase (short-subunit alcohol dehydrogenase family)